MCSASTTDLPVIKIPVVHLCSAWCPPVICLDVLGSVL